MKNLPRPASRWPPRKAGLELPLGRVQAWPDLCNLSARSRCRTLARVVGQPVVVLVGRRLHKITRISLPHAA